MSRNEFKVGDLVTPVDPARRTFGYTGKVTHSYPWGDVVVDFPHLNGATTFYKGSLRLAINASPKTTENSDVHIVVYDFTDDLSSTGNDIFDDSINSQAVKNAIVSELNEGSPIVIVTHTQLEVDDALADTALSWEYVYGLYNGKPFRITTKPKTEIAE